jgi:hypothetical protein
VKIIRLRGDKQSKYSRFVAAAICDYRQGTIGSGDAQGAIQLAVAPGSYPEVGLGNIYINPARSYF